MANIAFPTDPAPSNGDTYSEDGVTWQYNSADNTWRIIPASTPLLPVANIDLTNATDIGRDLEDADLLVVNDKKSAASRVWTYVKSKMADLGGSIIGSYRNAVVADVTGSLTTASHSGKHLITSGNIVVPNGAGDVGFSAVIRGGGAHTITFDGSVVRTLETDEIISVFVESTTSMALFVGSESTGGGTSLTQSAQTITDTDVTGAVNQHYLCTIAGLTANRALTLPAGTAGDKIRVTILDGDEAFGLEIKGATDITINGGSAAATWRTLSAAGYSVEFEATSASNWQVTVSSGERVPLSDQTASNDASLTFALPLGFAKYELHGLGIAPATDSAELNLTVSVDGGSNFAASNYVRMQIAYINASTSGVGGNNADSRILLLFQTGNQAGEVGNFEAILLGAESGQYFQINAQTITMNASSQNTSGINTGRYTGSTDRATHIKLAWSAGNFAAGRVKLYGLY
ncbi:MAG: hypothetical protein V2I26_11435 [Halieaceae bacterium]|jgi:hypothetical protein|nr:hypothetical protein [Halieaceae bacterium]